MLGGGGSRVYNEILWCKLIYLTMLNSLDTFACLPELSWQNSLFSCCCSCRAYITHSDSVSYSMHGYTILLGGWVRRHHLTCYFLTFSFCFFFSFFLSFWQFKFKQCKSSKRFTNMHKSNLIACYSWLEFYLC